MRVPKPKLYLLAAALLLAGICALWAAHIPALSRAQTTSAPSHFTPFTATYTVTEYGAAGLLSPRRMDNGAFAARSDGSTVRLLYRRSSTSAKPVVMRIVTDLSAGKRINIDPFSESTTTYPLSARQVASMAVPPTPCVGEPAGQILGYEVRSGVETISGHDKLGPALDETEETSWLAPALNCLALRTEASQFVAGEVVGRRVESYTDVKLGEPDPGLFAIPENYVERPPSQAMAEGARRNPGDPALQCSSGCAATHSRFDEVYRRAQNQ